MSIRPIDPSQDPAEVARQQRERRVRHARHLEAVRTGTDANGRVTDWRPGTAHSIGERYGLRPVEVQALIVEECNSVAEMEAVAQVLVKYRNLTTHPEPPEAA